MVVLRRVLVAVALSGALVALPVALGASSGATSGVTNGPAGNADNCASCHEFGVGAGGVQLFGVPDRYIPGKTYDLTVRVRDDELVGAGFEISAERAVGHVGTLIVSDALNTQRADGLPTYLTHSSSGYGDSLSTWAANGNAYEYHLQWRAPDFDSGPVTFYTSGQATNDANSFFGEHLYHTHELSFFAEPADTDGDADVDLYDFAVMQECFGLGAPLSEVCAFLDDDGDDAISDADFAALGSLYTGPTVTEPAGFILADVVRGGLLYDKWWAEAKLVEPVTDHPLWASRPDPDSNTRSGAATWRCKECHGWDYKGVDGAYGVGSHRTGFAGILDTTKTARQLFDLLRDPADHAYTLAGTGLSDEDLWNLVRFVRAGLIDTDTAIDGSAAFTGDDVRGSLWYGQACFNCHGDDGTFLNFGTDLDPSFVGTVAVGNPWEFLHKTRFGHPRSPMVGTDLIRWDISRATEIGAYAQTLATE